MGQDGGYSRSYVLSLVKSHLTDQDALDIRDRVPLAGR